MSDTLARALAGDGTALLHRVQAEDGLAHSVGREAVLARLRPFAGQPVELALTAGDEALLVVPGAHLWAQLEAGRIAAMVIIAARPADPKAAAALALAHPCHRPLGELASGQGQLPPQPGAGPIGTVVHGFAARVPAVLAAGLAPLVTSVPDALLLPRRVLPLPDGGEAGLCQLLGHSAGRRISLALSLQAKASGAVTSLAYDPLALAAAPLRPFWPD